MPTKEVIQTALNIDYYESLKCERLLKYGYPKKYLWLTECTTTEDFQYFYGDDIYFDLGLDKYKYVVYYHESGSVEQHSGFDDEKGFDTACKWIADCFKPEVADDLLFDDLNFFNKLQEIKLTNFSDFLKQHVLDYVLELYKTDKEIKSFFSDLSENGCVSGMINHLIYYFDTHKFYDKYYEEIETLRLNWEDDTGEPVQIKEDLKNYLAWFGFEQTAYQIASELGI